jgi:hypothetical protein
VAFNVEDSHFRVFPSGAVVHDVRKWLQHVLKLLGFDTSLVLGEEQDRQELTDNIPVPVQDSGIQLS